MLWGSSRSGTTKNRAPLARSAERFPAAGLRCPLGEVADLSMTGLRARCRGRPALQRGDAMTLMIESDSQRIRVSGKAVWVRRVGLRTFEVGVQFFDVRPGIASALAQLARYGFIPAGGIGPGGAEPAPAAASAARPVTAAVEIEDLYAVFGVARDASDEVIRDTYHALARRFHPDVCEEPGAQERFTLISKAYSVLRDADRRSRYDAMLARAGRAA